MSSPKKKTDKSILNKSNVEIVDKAEYFKKELLKTNSVNNNFINNNNAQIEVNHTRKIAEPNSNDTNDKNVKKLKSFVCYICLSTTCLKAFCPKLKAKEKITSLLPTPRNTPTTATKVQKATTPSSTTPSSTKQSPTTTPANNTSCNINRNSRNFQQQQQPLQHQFPPKQQRIPQVISQRQYKSCREFGVKCPKCLRVIFAKDWVRKAREFTYHIACFACDSCKRQLSTGEEFALRGDRLLCKPHYIDLIEGGPGRESASSQKPKAKRVRTTFTEEQLQFLQAKFQLDSNPDGNDLEQIAAQAGLSKRVTQVWFQNSRARQKKYQQQRNKINGSSRTLSPPTGVNSSMFPCPATSTYFCHYGELISVQLKSGGWHCSRFP
ncbi:LIM/homeobox protein Lhx6-like [Octopus sinensis]|uniref:LIM/homeobox protein Lhx6-like n=2 Tax=Octopus TaxID=6643 RepID=A0A6P7U779_9MOLL|nr:LIM/homeobox protein Lhx6-like [Octopus sinensis]